MTGQAGADPALTCSAKGCSATATQAVLWRNPRIHTEDRRKVWLACDPHEVTLREYLSVRGFPVASCPVDEIPEGAG